MLLATVEQLAPATAEETPTKANTQEGAPRRRRRRRVVAPEPVTEEPAKDQDEVAVEADTRYGNLIRGVYQRHNPAKLGEVESLLEKYKGMEAALYQKVCEKYREHPEDVAANDARAGADESPGAPRGFAKKASAPPPVTPAPKVNALAAAPPSSRVAAGEAWPFEEDEVSMNSESSDASSESGRAQEPAAEPEEVPRFGAGVLAAPPAPAAVVPGDPLPEEPNSPSSASSSSSASLPAAPAHAELMQRFSSLANPRSTSPGSAANAASWTQALRYSEGAPPRAPEPDPLPAWARPPGSPPRAIETPREREEAPLPAWAMQDGPPGDWSSRPRSRYSAPPPPSYGNPRMPPPPGSGPWGKGGWGFPPPSGYGALPAPPGHQAALQRPSWGGDAIGSAWAS
mmetsp:Transcript_62436/g.146398  ORF Transcript_62436/g.146398 Transcript_62436/m.146398 type:complete len:400 (+) Transcript_62436:85-1284(+)